MPRKAVEYVFPEEVDLAVIEVMTAGPWRGESTRDQGWLARGVSSASKEPPKPQPWGGHSGQDSPPQVSVGEGGNTVSVRQVHGPPRGARSGWSTDRREKDFGPRLPEHLTIARATNYRDQGKKERQAAQMPELQETIRKAKEALGAGVKYPSWESRRTPEYLAELKHLCDQQIEPALDGSVRRRLEGRTAQERQQFWDEVIVKNTECWWIDGCAAPTVKGYRVNMEAKKDAVPVAMQPIPLSPYDRLRVQYHIWEAIALGKMREVDTVKEGPTEWASPVFVVDQDAKGLLGRMVNACGKVNDQLKTASFPSADVIETWRRAAGCEHHTVIDAIWGYTQFLLDEETRKRLRVVSPDGVYEWLRMPFGPAPAPAIMQSYVAKRFRGPQEP